MVRTIDTAEEFVRLRSSEVPDEYLAAAHGEATDDVWLEVLHRFPEYAWWVAHNKRISETIIRVLAAHADANVRAFIASKRRTPADLLSVLAQDEDAGVRRRVAYNAKATHEVLSSLLIAA